MLKKRVIFTLLYSDGYFMLSRNFRLQKVGDLHWLQENYNFSQIAFSIDELVILDVTRGPRDEEKFLYHVRSLANDCFIPIAVGGGVRTFKQARELLRFGADKVVLNTLVYESPEIVRKIAEEFGQQYIIVSIDIKQIDNDFVLFSDNGNTLLNYNPVEWLSHIADLPVGELYLNSIDHDGTGYGYKTELLELLPDSFMKPVILAGGAGKYSHFAEALLDDRVDAVATAHLFNFMGDGLEKSRAKLLEEKINLSTWDLAFAREVGIFDY